MRRAIGPALPVLDSKPHAAQGLNCGRFERFVIPHLRQQAGEACGEHRLARTWRPHHEHAMATRSRHFQGPLDVCLPFHFVEVRIVRRGGAGRSNGALQLPVTRQVGTHLKQRFCGQNTGIADEARLAGTFTRKHKGAAGFCRPQCHAQCAAHRTQLPRKRQLPGKFIAAQAIRRYLSRGCEDAKCDRQVETSAFLGQFRRRKVDRHPTRGKFETAVCQGGTHAVTAFPHFRIGQPDDGEGGQSVGEMDFDRDRRSVHAS